MCPEEYLPVSQVRAFLHYGGFLTPSVRSHCVPMTTETSTFCATFHL